MGLDLLVLAVEDIVLGSKLSGLELPFGDLLLDKQGLYLLDLAGLLLILHVLWH